MMRLLKRAFLVLGLAGCVLFASSPATQAIAGEERLGATRIDIVEDAIAGETTIHVRVRDPQRPFEFYTLWIRLDGKSPLTGEGSTAAASTTAIGALATVTPAKTGPGNIAQCKTICVCDPLGTQAVVNGFVAGSNGDADTIIVLDFLLSDGFYPFSQFDPTLADVAIKRAADGAALRVASHPCDGFAHGLIAGKHDKVFDWYLP